MSIDLSGRKFKWKGRYAQIREIYFKQRSPLRERELENLVNDVEYVIHEIKRIEYRSRIPTLVGVSLRNLYAKLLYWEHRKTSTSDNKTLEHIADLTSSSKAVIRIEVFRKNIDSNWFLTETEGGKEIDLFLPPGENTYMPPQDIKIMGRKYEDITKKQMWEFVKRLLREIDELRKKCKS